MESCSILHRYVRDGRECGQETDEIVIFPFINQMVEELGVTDNPDRVGFYSGLVVS
jgi:hypothetical protein